MLRAGSGRPRSQPPHFLHERLLQGAGQPGGQEHSLGERDRGHDAAAEDAAVRLDDGDSGAMDAAGGGVLGRAEVVLAAGRVGRRDADDSHALLPGAGPDQRGRDGVYARGGEEPGEEKAPAGRFSVLWRAGRPAGRAAASDLERAADGEGRVAEAAVQLGQLEWRRPDRRLLLVLDQERRAGVPVPPFTTKSEPLYVFVGGVLGCIFRRDDTKKAGET